MDNTYVKCTGRVQQLRLAEAAFAQDGCSLEGLQQIVNIVQK